MTPDSIRDKGDDLLKPRYKVIADYPENPFVVGAVLNEYTEENEGKKYLMYAVGDHDFIVFGHDEYPHLFKPLHWYEEREESKMPEYVCFKTAIPLTYKKVTKWWLDADKNWWADYDKKSTMLNMWAIEPATLAEYTDYLTQINKK